MDNPDKNRRTFLGKALTAGAAGAALMGTSPKAKAASKNSGDFFRVGCLNVESYSHLIGIWGPLINQRKGEKDTPFTGMRTISPTATLISAIGVVFLNCWMGVIKGTSRSMTLLPARSYDASVKPTLLKQFGPWSDTRLSPTRVYPLPIC